MYSLKYNSFEEIKMIIIPTILLPLQVNEKELCKKILI